MNIDLHGLGFAKEDPGEFSTYDGEFHPAQKLLLDLLIMRQLRLT
jgi:hypothetical protein